MADTIPIVQELQGAMAMANCFCQNGFYQYEWPSGNLFGVCVGSLNQNDYQQDARKYCKGTAKEAYLVSEFDKNKRAFNYDFITNHGTKKVDSYYNGLVSQNGSWFWDQPKGKPLLPLDPSSGSVSTSSGCIADIKYSDGSISWAPISCGYRLPYLCEVSTCDTDFYCF
uniref:C-type lectin domain-containing protein n=1 Tax=Caenorhabditis tropicalis TaxID=1561998 RepID=A0A1I7TAB9_9PELO